MSETAKTEKNETFLTNNDGKKFEDDQYVIGNQKL